MGTRHRARETALQVLYQIEFTGQTPCEVLEQLGRTFRLSAAATAYARQLSEGVMENLGRIDERIDRAARNWRLERMSIIDRNIMRIAVLEMDYLDGVPAGVAINEAMEIAKRFGTDESGPFINGILDGIRKSATDTGSEPAGGR